MKDKNFSKKNIYRLPKNIILSLGIIAVVLCAQACIANPIREKLAFLEGESISYEIKKFGLNVGKATLVLEGFTRKNNQETFLLVFTAEAMNFYDEEKIYLDPKTLFPIVVERDLNIFGKKEKITEQYNQKDKFVEIIKHVGKKTENLKIEKDDSIENLYGFILRYRMNGKFRPDDTMVMHLPTKDVTVKLIKESEVRVLKEKRQAYFMRSDSKKYKIWFDTGYRKIPLIIDGAVGLANAKLVMSKYTQKDQ